MQIMLVLAMVISQKIPLSLIIIRILIFITVLFLCRARYLNDA
jgi:hypothetical protein